MSRRPRLLMVVHGPYPVGEPRVAREARAASGFGFDVDVLALRRRGEPALERDGQVTIHRLPLSHRRGVGMARMAAEYVGFTALASVATAVLHARRRYDVVQVHNPPDFLIAAGVLPKLLGARLVFDVHDLAPDMFEMRFAAMRGGRACDALLRLCERAATRLADVVVTVHEPYRRELVARGVARAKVVVVMNSVDEALVGAGPPSAAADGFRIVYHGTLTPHYGVDLVVRAFAELAPRAPDARLEIYGEGDAREDLVALARSLGVAERVRVTGGYLAHAEVLERIRGAAVGVVPNRPTRLNRFALSSKLFEYVALGIPVVSADLPTIREHFDDDEVRYFAAGDAASLAGVLLEEARDGGAATARAAAALRRYEAYRWRANAGRYRGALVAAGA